MVLKTISPGCGVQASLMLFFTFDSNLILCSLVHVLVNVDYNYNYVSFINLQEFDLESFHLKSPRECKTSHQDPFMDMFLNYVPSNCGNTQ